MPRIAYITRKFSPASAALIANANRIIAEYQRQGYTLTLRQLYYQFVSRDLISNKVSEYKRLGSVINDARLAGKIDWLAIEDRTRNLHRLSTWDHPSGIVRTAAQQFKQDLWETQRFRVEVWIEKEALAGVFERVCDELRVPFFACRGYTSQSEMWSAAQRLLGYREQGQTPVVLHFGDHDPSGIDMTRDIIDRLELFTKGKVRLERLALNMDQIEQYEPPPNPAKETDSRFQGYLAEYGDESWELDALEPSILAGLVETAVDGYVERTEWDGALEQETEHRETLAKVSHHWSDVADLVAEKELPESSDDE